MHRVVYFKYRDLVLWDKEKRLDRLFGSGGTLEGDTWHSLSQAKDQKDEKEVEVPRIVIPQHYSNFLATAKPKQAPVDAKLTQERYHAEGKHKALQVKEKEKSQVQTVQYEFSFGICAHRVANVGKPNQKDEFLLIQHKKNKQWSVPKGEIHAHEPPTGFVTALREFEKGAGLNAAEALQQVYWNVSHVSAHDSARGKTLTRKTTVIFLAEAKPNNRRVQKWQSRKRIVGERKRRR